MERCVRLELMGERSGIEAGTAMESEGGRLTA
jgi:hypothetical protein